MEVVLRQDLLPLPVVVAAMFLVLTPLWWRRTHPLVAVAMSIGTLTAFDFARILTGDPTYLPASISGVLVLTYALFRWGSGREATIGLGIILVWLGISTVADASSTADAVAAFAFFLFSAALGAAIRYYTYTRARDIERAQAREREQLARDLHDTVAHHVSGIAIQAQAGRAIATSQPERAVEVLAVIEEAAARTLSELRSMVGVLRHSEGAEFSPRRGVADLAQLAGGDGALPQIDVELAGELDGLSPAVGAALYRLTQESITNAQRHARQATRVTVRVVGDAEHVQLTVENDGALTTAGDNQSGYGLVGMRERAKLLGGTFHAGPSANGGWWVAATLPREGVSHDH